MPTSPALARVLRADRLESLHRGDIAVVDERGALLAWAGDPQREIFLRSAAKPFQALPLLMAGGQRMFRLDNDEIALMCASHGGEPRHVRVARRLLAKGGFRTADLLCGAHAPMHEPSARALIAKGRRPTALHNNCSGKHAGMLLACRLNGFDPSAYCDASHPAQREILSVISDFCGVSAGRVGIAVDGCSLPVFRLPLSGLARGYARLVARGIDGDRALDRARRRVIRAMWQSPGMVAGLERFTTALLEAGRGRWIGKEGAEGVYAVGCAATEPRGRAVGIAFKIEDGSSRPRDAVSVDLLARWGRLTPRAARRLGHYREPVLRNVAGRQVGRIESVVLLAMGR